MTGGAAKDTPVVLFDSFDKIRFATNTYDR
jgi:hypothetical protein